MILSLKIPPSPPFIKGGVETHEGGYILITTLGLLSALLILALSLGATVRSDLVQSRQFQDETAAEFLAKGGLEWAMHYLNELERNDRIWQAPWTHPSPHFQNHTLGSGAFDLTHVDATGTQQYGMQDEAARINLNTASQALLAALPGLTAATARAIVTQRRQRPFATPEELLDRGIVSSPTFYGTPKQHAVSPYLTVWGSGKINLNTAPLPVLAALPGMTAAMATAVRRYRQGDDQEPGTADDRHFRTVDDLLTLPEIGPTALPHFKTFLTVVPTAFRVIVTGRVPNAQGVNRTHQRLAVIDRASRPTRILYWQRLE